MRQWRGREAHGGMIRTMLKTSGTVAISVGALLTAGGMNLAVLNQAPSGPGNLVLRAASSTTTTSAAQHPTPKPAAAQATTSTTGAHRSTKKLAHSPGPSSTTTDPATTTTGPPSQHGPTTTTTHPPVTTTTKPVSTPASGRLYMVRNAGRVHVRWVNKRIISAEADPNAG